MSGSRPTVDIRISAQGGEKVKRDLEAIDAAGTRAMASIGRASAAAAPEMQKLATASDVVQRTFTGLGGTMGRIGGVFTSVSGVAGVLTTSFVALGAAASIGAAQIARAGDEASATLARLTSATGGLAQAQAAYQSLFALSQQTGVAVSESAGSFARFSVAAKEVGGTTAQVLALVGGIQKAGIVAGASAQEAGAAVQQLGQALASGKLQGDELRSLLENMPQLAQALAGELGVGIGRLREMGSEGKLTAEVIFPALLRASEKMGAEFDRMPLTIARAAGALSASGDNFGAQLDKALGLSQGIARALKAAADLLTGLQAELVPTEQQAARREVAAAERRLADLRGRPAPDLPPEPRTAEERRAATPIPGRDPFDTTRQRFATPPGGRDASQDRANELAEAEQGLRDAIAREQSILREGRESRRADEADAAAQRLEARRLAAKQANDELRLDLFRDEKVRKEHAEKIKNIDTALDRGAISGVEADRQRKKAAEDLAEALEKIAKDEARGGEEARKAAEKRQGVIDRLNEQVEASERALLATQAGTAGSREMAIALEVENRLREAGIPALEKRTEAQKRDAAAIETSVRRLDELKTAEKQFAEETKKARDFANRSWEALGDIGVRAMDRVGDAAVNALLAGEGRAINFGNVLRGVAASMAADLLKLAAINPFLNWAIPSSQGPRPTLMGAFGASPTSLGGGFGLGDIFGGGLGSAFSGFGSSVTSGIFGTAGASFSDLGGITVAGSPGLFGLGGQTLFGGSAPSFGGMLGGIGAGFGAGNLLGGLIAQSAAQRTNAMIGSALGSIIGSIGGPIGSLIGGVLGGAGGGLIGPKESVKGWSYAIRSTGASEGWEPGAALKMDDIFFNESGRAQFDAANASIAAINEFLAANNLTVWGARAVGGNKDGPDDSWGGAASFGAALADLRFGATGNDKLNAYLSGQSFDDPAKLTAAVEGFKQTEAAFKALTEDAVPAFTAQLDALNDNFDSMADSVRKYGFSEDALTAARTKAVLALEAQRTETLRQSDAALEIRGLVAAGQTQQAELLRQAEAARLEVDAFGKSLDALAITAEDRTARLARLEQVQAAEREAILARGADAGRNLLRELTFGRSSALAPEQQYFAALTTLNQAKRDLDAGGSLASYSAIASQVLPVARDFLGTSQRYAGLAAEVGQVLASHGADGAGLSAILSAQVDGMAGMQSTFATYGDASLSELRSLRAEVARLSATLEAVITRRSAA